MSTHPTPARPLWGIPAPLVTAWGAVATFFAAGAWVSRVVGGDPGILDWTLAAIGVVLAVVEVRLLVMSTSSSSSTSLSQALLWTALAANAVGSRVDRDAVAVATLGATIACLVGAFLAYRAEQRRPRG